MEILGIGPMELILVLIIATVVFGPDKLPEIGAKLGQGLKSLRGITREFTRETQELREAVTAPVREIEQPLKEMVAPMREELAGLAPMAKAVTNPQEALRQAVSREMTAATAPAMAAVEAATNAAAGTRAEATVAPAAATSEEALSEAAARRPADRGLNGATADSAVLPASKTPQETLRRAVARELAQSDGPVAARSGGAVAATEVSAADNSGATASSLTSSITESEELAATIDPGAVEVSSQPPGPVPFFGLPQPGDSSAQAPAGLLNGSDRTGETATSQVAGVDGHQAAAAAAADGNELTSPAPQRVVRLKPRRLNRPYFGKNVSKT